MGGYTEYKWRIYADNDIERDIVEHLRRSGMDVLWISEDRQLRRQQDDRFHYQKAKVLGRYLLTKDQDFWDDKKHSLGTSPGVLIISTADLEVAKYLPVLLRKLIQDYNRFSEPMKLDGIKVRMGSEGFTLRFIDQDAQKVTIESFNWRDLV
jgi:predicted nuclease of predicted toxin-antitoxin system